LRVGRIVRRHEDRREYTLQGQILSIAPDHKEANIKHERHQGFHARDDDAYKVRDEKQFESIAPGDLISATLVVVSNDAYLKDVRKVGTAPLREAPGRSIHPRLVLDSSC